MRKQFELIRKGKKETLFNILLSFPCLNPENFFFFLFYTGVEGRRTWKLKAKGGESEKANYNK